MMTDFPPGNAAYQERFIAAHEHLTQLLASGVPVGGFSMLELQFDDGATYLAKWQEMFNTLIEEQEPVASAETVRREILGEENA